MGRPGTGRCEKLADPWEKNHGPLPHENSLELPWALSVRIRWIRAMAHNVFCSDGGHRHREWRIVERDVPIRIGPARARARSPSSQLLPPARFLDEMASINFRKIDIDVYDEDALVETELYDADPRDPSQVVSDAKQKATAVRSALSK